MNAGTVTEGNSTFRFVIHKHQTAGVHYDVRFEFGGSLKCWAVPRGPSLDATEKRLAVRTEDHPLALLDFEGTTYRADYGPGTVIIWDCGNYRTVGPLIESINNGRVQIIFYGEKLKGGWLLARMAKRRGRENWLLSKDDDEYARPPGSRDILLEQPRSVVSNLTIEGMGIRELNSEKRRRKPPSHPGDPKSRSFVSPD